MARPKGIPALTHHAASGRAVVRLDGKDHYCGPWDDRRDRPAPEARAAYQRLLAERAAGAMIQGPLETIGELAAAYWPHVRNTYRKRGKETSEVTAQKVALRYLLTYAACAVAEFGPLKLKAVRSSMVADGLHRKSINRHVGRIRQAFGWAAENELIDPLHPKRLSCLKGLRKGQGGVESTRGPVLTWERVAAVQVAVPRAVWAMIQLQWHTGMRSGEVIQMRGIDIDQSGAAWLYRPPVHKTEHRDKERVIAIGRRGQAVLKGWLRQDPAAYLFQPRESEQARNVARIAAGTSPHWPSHDPEYRRRKRGRGGKRRRPGLHYNKDSYRRAIARALEAAGRPAWHPHELRHAFATRARASFEHWDNVRAALGHTSAETTLEYARLEVGKAVAVAERLG